MRNAISRTGAFSVVVLLHIVVLTASWQRTAPQRKDQRFLTWVDIESPVEVPTPESKPSTRAREQDIAVRPSHRPAVAPAAPEIYAPAIDWRASAETAARAAAEEIIRQERYRRFGPIERGESGSSPSASIFERPRREAGDIDHDSVQGRTMIWHNENCYTELKFPTIKDPNAIVGAPNPPKCMYPLGRRRARDDLFDGIKDQ